jgi:hypothetical protein
MIRKIAFKPPALVFLSLALVACQRQPVAWDTVGAPTLSGVAAPATRGTPQPESGMCRESVRVAGHSPVLWAAWWTVRPDSSVVLRIARSDDAGNSWEPAIAADTTDRGVRGCARPAPAIAYDADSNWVHLAYFLEPTAGPGVYYEHYMATMFHARVPIVFGERAAAVAVAASHDTVVVAYEDPNRRVSQVAIALSTTAGHLFTIGTPVSGEDVAAYRPAVTLSGDRVAVAWLQTASDEGDPAPSDTGRRVTRSGRIE